VLATIPHTKKGLVYDENYTSKKYQNRVLITALKVTKLKKKDIYFFKQSITYEHKSIQNCTQI